jgi:hypothetical protein
MGTWRSTFGSATSDLTVTGNSAITIFNNNSTGSVPTFQNKLTIEEGKTLTINTGQRCKIQGSLLGQGTMNISFPYVRGDFGMKTSAFEGTLNVTSGQFRITSAMDLAKGTMKVGAGVYVVHVQSQSSNETNLTSKIGALQGTATDGVLGGSQSSYQAGFLNEDSKFSGLLKGQRFTKVGTGKLTLVTAGHTSPITVSGGMLVAQNTTSADFTSAAVTVGNGGTLAGTALLQNVTVQKGGTILGGLGTTGTGVLRLNGNLVMNEGSSMRCLMGNNTGNARVNVKGSITHNGDTLVIVVPASRKLSVGDEIQVFSTGFSSASGEVIVRSECEDYRYEFDSSLLNSDGKVTVTLVEELALRGDVNGDKVVNGTDIQEVINFIIAGVYDEKADVNGDCVVNGTDIQEIINIIVNAD